MGVKQQAVLDLLAKEMQPYKQAKQWWVACSGGKDSMVLLDALVELSKLQSCPPVRVVHIHHGLQQQATFWAAKLYDYCLEKQLSIVTYWLSPKEHKQTGIEAWARKARYGLFKRLLHKDDVLLMAHHANDQAETFLWHAIRGSGLDGLSAMPKQRQLGQGLLVRPLLHLPQQMIHDYQQEMQLAFSQDPSNFDDSFTRNKIRLDVMPALEKTWPRVIKTFGQNAEILQQQRVLLEKYLNPEFASLFVENPCALEIARLLSYEEAEQAWFIRYWLKQFDLSVPSQSQLNELLRQLQSDNQLVLDLDKVSIRRYQNKLYLVKPRLLDKLDNFSWCWQSGPLEIYDLSFTAADLFSEEQLAKLTDQPIDVRFGQAGESIKKFWQSRRVPPWCRPYLPIFYQGEHRLVEVEYEIIYQLWLIAA